MAQQPTKHRRRAETRASEPTTDLPPEVIAAKDFLDRNSGALPEEITAADLQTLNAGLGFFFSRLRLAAGLFHQSSEESRHAAIVAVDAAWRLIALFRQPYAEILHVPMLHLRDALGMLDEGTVAPMLERKGRPGRPRSPAAYAALRGKAAGTVALLVEAGFSLRDAYGLVAEALVELGVRPEHDKGRSITATTVRHWCGKMGADTSRNGTAAIIYDDMFTDEARQRFASLPSDKARQARALNNLAAFVRAHFPRA